MRLILIASLLSCYKSDLPQLNVNNIRTRIHDRHFIVGLYPSTQDLLQSLSWLFRDEDVEVGFWDASDELTAMIPWDKTIPEYDKRKSKLAFFQRIPLDRKCLIKIEISIKAIPIPSENSLPDVIKFLNKKCFTFVGIDGTLLPKGKHRKEILKNLYSVPNRKSNKAVKCQRIPAPKTKKDFARDFLYRSRPVIIENAFNNWDALRKWSNDFLRDQYADKKVHVKLTPNGEFEGCDLANKFENFDVFKIPDVVKSHLSFPDLVVVRPAVGNMRFGEFLDVIENKKKDLGNISAYLEYSSIREYFPELEHDLNELRFIGGLLKLSHLNIWLSNGRTLGKLHFDPFDNILCQLRGNKKFTIFEPHHNYNLYEAHIQEAVLSFNPKTRKFRNAELLDSTSMVMSPIDILKPDYERFPNFTKAIGMECFLNEGDALYLPSFWWHEVQSYPNKIEGRNVAVNFWYEPFLTKEFPCVDCKLDVNPSYEHLLRDFL